jgi:hypothetical protein
LEEMRLKQTRLLLNYQGEGLERKLTEDMDSAQDAIERAREATEEMEARRLIQKQREEEEERERERLKRETEQRKRWGDLESFTYIIVSLQLFSVVYFHLDTCLLPPPPPSVYSIISMGYALPTVYAN